jgi:diguanylate cyclase (GGDEF)-like protein
VAVPGLVDRTRRRLLALLADDRPEPGGLTAAIREVRDLEGVPAFGAAIHLLAGLELSDGSAEKLLADILAHRADLGGKLQRDPGLRVAAVDFLSNIEPRMTHPAIVERSRLEEAERSAVTDPLTGLYNRRFFRATFEREVRRGHRYGVTLSLIMLDVDGFKRINDEYGHLFGDLVLRRVAKLVRRAIRESDTASRYGGEEFAIILPETDRLGSFAVAERIRRRVETAFAARPTSGRPVAMTVSGGIASYPDDGSDLAEMLGRADEALYRAKTLGKNRIALHHAERRAFVRYPARETARVELGSAPGAGPVPAVPVNLSRSGALVTTRAACRPAEAVVVRLVSGDPPGRGRSWWVQGRVVRVGPPDGSGPEARVGIAFDRPLPEACLRAQTYPAAPVRGVARGGGG